MTNYKLKKLSYHDTPETRAELKTYIAKIGKTAQKKLDKLDEYASKASEVRAHSFAREKLEGALESLDLTTDALDPSTLDGLTAAELARLASAIQAFNQSETSSVTGIKKQQSNLRRVLRDAGIAVPRGENWDKLLEVFSSEAFSEFETWSSGRRFKIATQAVKAGIGKEELDALMEEYRENKDNATLDVLWDKWVGFNPFLVSDIKS